MTLIKIQRVAMTGTGFTALPNGRLVDEQARRKRILHHSAAQLALYKPCPCGSGKKLKFCHGKAHAMSLDESMLETPITHSREP